MPTELNEDQFSALVWELRAISTFFPEPLTVEYGGKSATVGTGYGGLSPLVFSRGTECVLGCGNCCRNTFRTAWFWYESEVLPREPKNMDGEEVPIEPLDVLINGSIERFWTARQTSQSRCQFLTQDNLCGIHTNGKPLHCVMTPQFWVYPHKDNEGESRLWFTRRLPPRNWRWPKCPIDMSTVPYTDQTRVENDLIFTTLAETVSFDPKAHKVALDVLEYVRRPEHSEWSMPFPVNLEAAK